MSDNKEGNRVKAEDYGGEVLRNLSHLRDKSELCDFRVSAGGHVFEVSPLQHIVLIHVINYLYLSEVSVERWASDLSQNTKAILYKNMHKHKKHNKIIIKDNY